MHQLQITFAYTVIVIRMNIIIWIKFGVIQKILKVNSITYFFIYYLILNKGLFINFTLYVYVNRSQESKIIYSR